MTPSASRTLLPILTFVFFGSIALLLWRAQGYQEHRLILHHVENSVEQAAIRIQGVMKARTASLEILADRWVERTPPDFSKQRFLSFAGIVFEHYPGFTAILWLNPDGSIQYAFPEGTDATAKGKMVLDRLDPQSRAALEEATQKHALTVTACVELYQGLEGFQVILPLIYNGELLGYLSGVFQVARIVDIALPERIVSDFAVSIHDGKQPIFLSGPPADAAPRDGNIRGVRAIEIGDRTWRLSMEPGKEVYTQETIKNLPFLSFGIVLSAVLSLLLYLVLLRMEKYRESRDLALHEVSERKRAEETLRENEKKLESLLAELSTKNAELESFVYTISHDLKTPIVTIEGSIGALREDFGEALPQDAEKYMNYMSHAARKMELLINDLLELSRIGRLVVKKTTIPFGNIIRDALVILQPQIDARGISIDVQPGLPDVYGENKRLGQVVYNLLNNAVKYIGKDNPAPHIEVGMTALDGRNAFYVRDNGIGIDAKYFHKIFQIFERLPSAKHEEGTGIGLTIVKRIVEYHGGTIWLTSEPGKGSTFFFTLDERET